MTHSPVSAVSAALAVLALSLAGCSDPAPTAVRPTAAQAHHNQADIDFVTAMAAHHQQALDMTALVPGQSHNDELKAIAVKIKDAQAPEIEKFHQLGGEFDPKKAPMPSMSMPSMSMPMDGMVPDKAVQHLKALSGAEFDRAWAGLMIEHHKGAVDMAKDEVSKGENPEVKKIAESIVDAQTAEIDELGKILESL